MNGTGGFRLLLARLTRLRASAQPGVFHWTPEAERMRSALEMHDLGVKLYQQGYKFSAYATWWIRQAITRALAHQAQTIRIPVHLVEVLNQLNRVQRRMHLDLGREPLRTSWRTSSA